MSNAFTREENDGSELPELPPLASTLPQGARNDVTPAGAERLRNDLSRLVREERPALAAMTDPDVKRRLAQLDQRIRLLE